MKTKPFYSLKTASNVSFLQRVQGVIWASALFVCFFTCCAPVLIESNERYVMNYEITVKGYDMISYAPLLSLFLLVAPCINAALHTSKLAVKKKIIAYCVIALTYAVTCLVITITAGRKIMLLENSMVVFYDTVWLIPLVYYLHLLIGLLPISYCGFRTWWCCHGYSEYNNI